MNFVLHNRDALSERHYIRKADPNNNYWVDFSAGPLEKYINQFGDAFCLVIAGDADTAGDFFAIPYSFVADLFTASSQTNDKKGRLRWVGNVINFRLRITNSGTRRDISEYYGRPELLDQPTALSVASDEYDNEYAIQNRRAEVNQRLKQSVFRTAVLNNFQGRCCITGMTETDLLIASHIIPWSRRIDTRLDPANGLCLSAWIDRLFDRGFISFTDDLCIMVARGMFSDALTQSLTQLQGQQAQPPIRVAIKTEYLQWHRDHIYLNNALVSPSTTKEER